MARLIDIGEDMMKSDVYSREWKRLRDLIILIFNYVCPHTWHRNDNILGEFCGVKSMKNGFKAKKI